MAIRKAEEYTYDEPIGYYLAAVIARGNSVISVGYNKLARNSFVNYISTHDNAPKPFLNTHAEVDAILKARAKTDLRGCKIYVARIKPSGGAGNARPCEYCQLALGMYGIQRAYYTIDSRSYGVLHVAKSSDKLHNLLEVL